MMVGTFGVGKNETRAQTSALKNLFFCVSLRISLFQSSMLNMMNEHDFICSTTGKGGTVAGLKLLQPVRSLMFFESSGKVVRVKHAYMQPAPF